MWLWRLEIYFVTVRVCCGFLGGGRCGCGFAGRGSLSCQMSEGVAVHSEVRQRYGVLARDDYSRGVTLQIIWRKTLHAIWRILRVWTNWRGLRERPEGAPLIDSACSNLTWNNDRPLKAVAVAAGIPFRTAQHWVSHAQGFSQTATAAGEGRRTGRQSPPGR